MVRKIGRSAALYAALLAAGLAVGLHGSHAAISEVVDWETGDLSQTSGLECPTSSNFSIVTSPVRQGKYAARYHLDSNSALWSNGWPRCLATRYDSAETPGDDYYYGFSAYIPQKWASMLWVLHQPSSIYNISGCAVAPLAVQTQNGSQGLNGVYFRIATGDCSPQMANYATGWPHQEMNIALPSLDPTPLNTWIDFVIHVKFSETNGTVEVWDRYNGAPYKLELTRTGIPTTQYCSSCGIHNVKLYMEQGLYTYPLASGESDDLYLDNYIRGASFDEVAPGGSSAPAQTTTASSTTQSTTTTSATTTTATTTTSATTTTTPTTTSATTTTTPTTTTTTTTTTPTTTSTTLTPSGNTVNGKGKGLGNGQGVTSSNAQAARTLAAVEISRPLRPADKRWIRVVKAAVSVRGAQSVRVSLISRRGQHRRLPLLAHSLVGSVDINYWRKTIVTGPQPDGRLALRLRVPRLVLASGDFALRVRTMVDGSIRTSYLRFSP